MTPYEDLAGKDWFVSVMAKALNATIGCGEPVGVIGRAVTLDGEPAMRFERTGVQARDDIVTVETIAKRGGICYQIQLMATTAETDAQCLAMFEAIEGTFRFKS